LHAPTRRRLSSLLTIPIALAVAACAPGSQAGGTSGAQAGGGTSGNPTISIAVPADGATVQVAFDVQLESSVPLGDPETGNHHAHLYFDTEPGGADYDIVYGNTWQVTRQLTPGQHTVTVALANPDHSLAGPTQSITIQVGAGAAGGGASSAPSPTEVLPGY
jgi:hypothetical protein